MNRIESLNDFVIKFANVNGTGSASANNMFAKSLFRMGLPISPKNIFPSNIQGLPTWYEVRVSEKGYTGRRGGTDIMVSVNPQSMARDIREVEPGGYFIYDSTKPLDLRLVRDDIVIIGIPLMQICIEQYKDARQRQLFKNIIYVGALAALLDMDLKVIHNLVNDQFKGKEKIIVSNVQALELGYQYIKDHYFSEGGESPCGIRVESRDVIKDRILIDGNTACGLGAVYGGATFCAWYPITPSTSVAEGYETYCKRLRVDPGSGKNNFAIVPSTPKDCFEQTAEAFDLAETLQTPVIMLTDLDLGMNDNISEPFVWDDAREYKRGKVLNADDLENMSERFGRYLDVDGDGIPYRTYPGTHPTKGSFFTRGTSRDPYAVYTEDSDEYVANMERLEKKWDTAKNLVPKPEIKLADGGSKIGVLCFGTSAQSTEEALDYLREDGLNADYIRLNAFPFTKEVEDFIESHELIFVVEQNRDAQMRSLIINELETNPKKLIKVLNYGGMPITARFICDKINEHTQQIKVTSLSKKEREA